MFTRRHWQLAALSALACASLLAGCGGGDSGPSTTRVVIFGDSLSDLGTYTPATQIPLGQAAGVAPFFGGKFTTNTHTGYTAASNSSTSNTWGEWVAARLGVVITPAEVGFATTRVPCPGQASGLAYSCSGYGQGGSRITDPNGIGKSGGALTIPLVAQVASHNTRVVNGFTAGFGSGDIVFVWGGNNDVFVQFGAVAQGLPPATATANVQQAATELVALVKDQIVAKGAGRVAVMTLPDAAATPGFRTLPQANKDLLTSLSASFNSTLTTGLAGVAGVQIIDARALNASILASPASFGLTNVLDAACDPAKISAFTGGRVTDGSSLFCNAAPASAFVAPVPNLNGLKAGASASTWLFADSVHPSAAGHKIFADQVFQKLKDFGWIPNTL